MAFARWKNSRFKNEAAENFLDYLIALRDGATRVAHYPWFLQVEPTQRCNLRCPICRGDNAAPSDRGKDMSLDSFKAIIDEIGQYVYHIAFYRGGESLLHKDSYRMVEYAGKHSNATIDISTNMSFSVQDDDMDVLANNCNSVNICIDGLTQETHARYRRGGDFDKAFNNMVRLKQRVDALGSECQVGWNFIAFRHNEHEIETAKKIADDLGIHFVLVPPLVPDETWLPSNKALHRDGFLARESGRGEESNGDGPTALARCPWLYGGALVNWDLSLAPCCRVSRFDAAAFDRPFLDVFNGPDYGTPRHDGRCAGCPDLAFQEQSKTLRDVGNGVLSFIFDNVELFEAVTRERITAFLRSDLRSINNQKRSGPKPFLAFVAETREHLPEELQRSGLWPADPRTQEEWRANTWNLPWLVAAAYGLSIARAATKGGRPADAGHVYAFALFALPLLQFFINKEFLGEKRDLFAYGDVLAHMIGSDLPPEERPVMIREGTTLAQTLAANNARLVHGVQPELNAILTDFLRRQPDRLMWNPVTVRRLAQLLSRFRAQVESVRRAESSAR